MMPCVLVSLYVLSTIISRMINSGNVFSTDVEVSEFWDWMWPIVRGFERLLNFGRCISLLPPFWVMLLSVARDVLPLFLWYEKKSNRAFIVVLYNIIMTSSNRKKFLDVKFLCALTQPLLAHHRRVHQCLLTSRFIAPSIPWGVSDPVGKMRKQLLRDHNFLNNSPIFIIESSTFDIFAFQKALIQYISIWKNVLDSVIGTWQHNFMTGCGSLLWANTMQPLKWD